MIDPSAQRSPDNWLLISDVAAELRVSERTVVRWLKAPRGALLAFRVGNVTRIRRDALTRWVAAREKASA
jgi:excisionase family DNA binding protein